jgi:hypothetical protein
MARRHRACCAMLRTRLPERDADHRRRRHPGRRRCGDQVRGRGAQLVQFYSGMVYRGPALIGECVEAMRAQGSESLMR